MQKYFKKTLQLYTGQQMTCSLCLIYEIWLFWLFFNVIHETCLKFCQKQGDISKPYIELICKKPCKKLCSKKQDLKNTAYLLPLVPHTVNYFNNSSQESSTHAMEFHLSREVEITIVNVVALSSMEGSNPRNCASFKETCTDIMEVCQH